MKIDTPFGSIPTWSYVMISPDIEQGGIEARDKKGKILRRQIATTKDQIYTWKALGLELLIQRRLNMI
jgi:hypothetical protein